MATQEPSIQHEHATAKKSAQTGSSRKPHHHSIVIVAGESECVASLERSPSVSPPAGTITLSDGQIKTTERLGRVGWLLAEASGSSVGGACNYQCIPVEMENRRFWQDENKPGDSLQP